MLFKTIIHYILNPHRTRLYTAEVEHDAETGVYVGYVPGLPGAHTQGETLDELDRNLQEVLELILSEDLTTASTKPVKTRLVAV